MKRAIVGKLFQFQCQKEGTLFYYQSGFSYAGSLSGIIRRCPICGSRRIETTGRVFPGVAEDRPIRQVKP